MHRILLLAFACICSSIFANAQSGTNHILSGSLSDEQGEKLPFATITLHDQRDSSFVKGALSDEQGRFEIELTLKEGAGKHYFAEASLVGYNSLRIDIELNPAGGRQEFPPMQLQSNTTLKEVTVQATKPIFERKADRLSVNVENSILAAGNSVLEVLERSPGVIVNSSDQINLRGKSGVLVMIDGKPSALRGQELANYLRSMPAANIERIDIITNPSAKYDAAGNAGIIDIRLKKDRRYGSNGSLSTNYGQGVYPKFGAGLNLNYRNQKVNVFGSYNYSNRLGFNKLELLREFYEAGQLTGAYDQDNFLKFPFRFHTLRAGMDYYISKNTVVGFVAAGSRNAFDPNGTNRSDVLDGNRQKVSSFVTTNDSHDLWPSYSFNGNLKHAFKKPGRELSVDADYARYWNKTEQTFTTDYFDLNQDTLLPTYILYGDLQGDLQIRSIKADYTHPLPADAKWEMGIKSSWVSADNDLKFFDKSESIPVFDSTKSNHFIYSENINAAYVNASKNWKKWSLQVGLRLENTNAEGNQLVTHEVFDTSYINLFPSAFVQYTWSEQYQMGLNLSRRLDRPSYQQLNPFKFFLDPSTYREGNPYLRPQYTWSSEWTHTWKQKYMATLAYSRTTDNITEVIGPVEGLERVTVQTDKNLARFDYFGLSVNVPLEPFKWWTSYNDLSLYYGFYTGNIANTQLADGNVVAYISSNNTFMLPDNWSMELNGWYQTKQVYGFMTLEPMWSLSAGVQKHLFNKAVTVKLNVSDMFWQGLPTAVTQFRDYTEYFDVKRETRVANLSLSWRFGNNQVAPSRRRAGGAEEEKRRAAQSQG